MADIASTPVQKAVSFSRDLIARIEDFRSRNHLQTESEAILRLIELGLLSAGPGDTASAKAVPPTPGLRSVGPEDEVRAGPEAPDTGPTSESAKGGAS